MINEQFSLRNVFDLEKWQDLQDALAKSTKLAIITVDYKGIPMTRHSRCTRFCNYVRENKALSQLCQKCDARGGLEAVRLGMPYIYLCHFGIVDLASPIIVDNKYIGAVMAGQVKFPGSEESMLERIALQPKALEDAARAVQLKHDYADIPVLTYEEVKCISDMLFELCRYIVGESLSKNVLIESYKNALSEVSDREDFFDLAASRDISDAKARLSSALIDRQLRQESMRPSVSETSVLAPAIAYIYENKGEHVTMKDMAKLCHISSSHFSRVFSKEMGDNFSSYISRLKIEWAKQILESTDLSVSLISDELGFSDPGYFIKIFKRHAGVTPLLYRKYCRPHTNPH